MKIFEHFETYTTFFFHTCLMYITIYNLEHLTEVVWSLSGADPGGAPGASPSPKIGKDMIFWRKIVIFYTKYPKNVRASARRNFLSAPPPPKLKS
jgi:hypothetical protein